MNAKLSLTLRAALAVLLAVMMAASSAGTAHADRALGCDPKTGQPTFEVWGANPGKEISATAYAPDGSQIQSKFTPGADGNGRVQFGKPGVPYKVTVNFPWGETAHFGPITCQKPVPTGAQSAPPPHLANSKGNAPNSGSTNDPISTATGEYYFDLPLLDLGGPMSLQFGLHYGSVMGKWSGGDPFGGDHIVHNYQFAIGRTSDTALVVVLDNGNQINFQKSGNQWQVTREEVTYQLQETDKRYWMLDPIAGRMYTFDKAAVTTGTPMAFLTHIQDRNGNTLTFTNDNTGLPTRVEDGLGRSLTFTYADPSDNWRWLHLTQVADQTGRTVKFGYQTDTTSPIWTTHLTGVTNHLGATTVFTHTGPLTNTAITSIMYPRGNVPYTQEYTVNSGLWTVNSQTDASGNVTRLSSDKSVTTITDATGAAMQHTHKDSAMLSASKDATGKTATLTYDEAGRRTSITDRLGDTTKMTYHAPTGNLASVTNAKGETITYTYTPQEQQIGEAKFTFYNLTRVDYAMPTKPTRSSPTTRAATS